MQATPLLTDVTALYSAHADWLRGWLTRQTRCSTRAADLAQETFCRLLERRAEPSIRDPRNYLATVARRILIDDIRRRDVERAYLDAYALLGQGGQAQSPERIAEAIDLLGAIVRMLSGLSTKAQQAFLMIRFDGLRYVDAASALGISERMAKRYVAEVYAHCYAIAYAS